MTKFKFVNCVSDLDTTNFIKFTEKNKIVNAKGKEVDPSSYTKAKYRLVARELTTFSNLKCRKVKGIAIAICSFGIALFFESVRNYFMKDKLTTYAVRYVDPNTEVYRGYLYEIKNAAQETKGYLYGTIHIVDTPRIVLAEQPKQAFKKAKRLLVEIDLLADAECYGTKIPNCPKSLGYWGLDMHLLRKAKKRKMKTVSLENISNQVKIMNKYTSHKSAPDKFCELYKNGKNRFLDSWDNDKGLGKRNKMMLPLIKEALNKDKLPFVAVGIAHLKHDTGLIKLLEGKGWVVKQVKQ